MKLALSISICILILGCMQASPYTNLATPRADQRHWPNERDAIDTIILLNRRARYASSRPAAVKLYATFIRQCYAEASMLGADVDAGVRALNYLHKLHKQTKGKKAFWEDSLRVSKAKLPDTSPGHLPGLEPPEDYF